ncbi:hypothetical protein Dip510_001927 [Elusimicrobium posterum]
MILKIIEKFFGGRIFLSYSKFFKWTGYNAKKEQK